MFRIRRIYDDLTAANRSALEQVSRMLQARMAGLSAAKIGTIPDQLRDPLRHGFRAILYVAEGSGGAVQGFALISHDAELHFCYLDYLASGRAVSGRGVGGALYERVRAEAELLGVTGVFYECLPDDPALCRDPETLKENRARLRFYEGYGARPIADTAYETPVKPGGDNPPYLVFDGLGRSPVLERRYVRRVISRILTRKYKDVCSPAYVSMVVESVQDDPVHLREPRYAWKSTRAAAGEAKVPANAIALIVTDQHEVHHVRERGYVEAPVRIRTIQGALEGTGLFAVMPPERFEDAWITAVHDPAYVGYFRRVCAGLDAGGSVYPYVFPIRNHARPPVELAVRAGYYCIDTFTPLNRNAYVAARRAVDCALTGARELSSGRRAAYALVRPPGHHAERAYFGGFCYFNSAAIAAQYLSRFGKVAMLDIDYHHGNGQQSIFYDRRDVMTVSIHGHPRFAYPYFSGFADERGTGEGTGYNANYPLAENVDLAGYLPSLGRALARIRGFMPSFLVVCLGLDTAKGDPTGTWSLSRKDYRAVGGAIGAIRLPTLVVQEGGYDNRSIGSNAAHFFLGLAREMGLDRRDGGSATGREQPARSARGEVTRTPG